MSNGRRAGVVGLVLLALSLLACTLPIQLVVPTLTAEPIPSVTRTHTPAALTTRPASPTATWTISPTRTAGPSITPTTDPAHTATLPARPTTTPSPHLQAPTILSQVDYQVVERIVLTNAGPGVAERLTLWAALIRSLEPYQDVLDFQVQPSPFDTVEDEYGNEYARIEFPNLAAGESVEATLAYKVRVSGLAHDLSLCYGETISTFLHPEPYLESDNPDIQALAEDLSRGQSNPCQTLRALYDYVGDNISYSSYESGDRGAVWALEHGSGDCTEFTDALLALSRAAGIPARFLEGVTYREGAASQPGQIKHDWLEAYLPGHGWVPLDPTWGRFQNKRDAYFARISADHIIVTRGRNLSTLRGYHYFYYTWSGVDVKISHQESWELAQTG